MLLFHDKFLESAGAIVFKEQKVLMIKNTEKEEFTFPKGRIEENENYAQTARREVQEEAGILSIIGKKIAIETRYSKNIEKTKIVHWFLGSFEKQVEQSLEEHEKFVPVWVSITEASFKLTFSEDKDIFNEALKQMKEIR